MKTHAPLVALVLFAVTASAVAQDKKTADATPKLVPVATTKPVSKPVTDTATDDKGKSTAQPAQSQSLRANKKKTGGGQTEDDLYVGVK